jgi:hypothetical protein
MSECDASFRNKKSRPVIVASVSLLAVFAAGGILFGVIEHVRESVDRAH